MTMNPFFTCYARTVQFILKSSMNFIEIRIPEVRDSLSSIPTLIKEHSLSHPLIVSGKHVSTLPKFSELVKSLKQKNLCFSVFNNVKSDPTFENIESLYQYYVDNGCDSIIAIGGGSIIDASKALGARIARPKKSLASFRGLLKIGKDIPFFIAAPTTAGTGSEATLAAVITNEKNGDKFAVNDPHLVPNVAVLDDSLLKSLPQKTIAITGIDALCHAVEAYIGRSNSKLTRKYALDSISLIYDNLLTFHQNPQNDIARKKMLLASYYAGISFTRAYVGYVHSLAHAIGGMYHLPHGYCIAILLPYVLEAYGKKAFHSLGKINDRLMLSDPGAIDEEKALVTIEWIRNLNRSLSIPSSFDGAISEKDYERIAIHAYREAFPIYPVPRILTIKELKKILIRANTKTEENGK